MAGLGDTLPENPLSRLSHLITGQRVWVFRRRLSSRTALREHPRKIEICRMIR